MQAKQFNWGVTDLSVLNFFSKFDIFTYNENTKTMKQLLSGIKSKIKINLFCVSYTQSLKVV